MHNIDMKKFNTRTDLAIDLVTKKSNFIKYKYKKKNVYVTNIKLDFNNKFNKKKGTYITIEFDDITDTKNKYNVSKIVTKELKKILKNVNFNINFKTLIIGLGNQLSTPDSLGPTVIKDIIVTKHMFDLNLDVSKNYSNVSSLSPGVMGQTGIETIEIIKGVIKNTKPDLLIVIDALASSSINRLNKSIQITDTGISPGSGVLNKRKEISFETLGIPVIAVGVPTIVDASVIANDTINYLIKNNEEKKENFVNIIKDVLLENGYSLMVTPKEIDFDIINLSDVISYSINHSINNI